MENSYSPNPIDTSKVQLDVELAELTEFLAKNTHEVWSTGRMKDGWVYGKKRDDKLKHHPCLIAYEELPEDEKEYDRKTALETLRTIICLGYQVHPPLNYQSKSSSENISSLVNFIKEKNVDIENVFHIWHNRSKNHWQKRVEIYIAFAERALANAEHILCYDILKEGRALYPEHIKLTQLLGLCLARLGLQEDAREILENLFKVQKLEDEETLGLLGRIYKDYWLQTDKEKYYKASITYYEQCYLKYKSAWAGINLATLYQLGGEKEKAYKFANEVKKVCLLTIEDGSDDYWTYATMGEANFLEKDYNSAYEWYQKGVKKNPEGIGSINSTRRNVKLLFDKLNTPPKYQHLINSLLEVPKVICFTGHRVDVEGRESERFPDELSSDVKEKMKSFLMGFGPAIGFCSAANGGDIIFIESMVELGNKVHVVIPFSEKDFIDESVATGFDSNWVERFHALKEKGVIIHELENLGIDLRDESYIFANRILYGLARMKAKQLDTEVFPMAIWDSAELTKETAPGGTAHVLYEWQARNNITQFIDLDGIKKKKAYLKRVPSFPRDKKFPRTNKSTITCGIMFCDAVNYSQLKNTEFVLFNRIVHEIIEKTRGTENFKIKSQNIWGDGLHFIFRNLEQTGQFALRFTKFLAEHPWSRNGLSQPVQFRTAVHAGPVFETVNPLDQSKQYVGSHICRTARMESLTPAGQVYASQEFASLSEAMHIKSFTCAYVGKMYIQKEKVDAPLYHLREKIFEGN